MTQQPANTTRKLIPAFAILAVMTGCATHDPNQVRIEDRNGSSHTQVKPSLIPPVEPSASSDSGVARSYPAPVGSSPAQAPIKQGPIEQQSSTVADPAPVVINPTPPLTQAPGRQPSGALLALLEQAENHHQTGNNQRALAALERAQRIAPRDPVVYLQLARLRLDMKDYRRAEQLARKGLSLASGDPQMQQAFRSLLKRIRVAT